MSVKVVLHIPKGYDILPLVTVGLTTGVTFTEG